MIIKNSQLDYFKKVSYDDFIERMMEHAKKYYGEITELLNDAEIKAIITYFTENALKYSLLTEINVEKYIELSFEFAELTMSPMPLWVRDILTYPDMSEDMKIKKLSDLLKYGEPEEEDAFEYDEDEFGSTIV